MEPAESESLAEARRVLAAGVRSAHTAAQYLRWMEAYVQFHRGRDPRQLGHREARAYLQHLGSVRKLAPSTQRQARSALRFLYRHVLGIDEPWLARLGQPREARRPPVVLEPAEVSAILAALHGETLLLAQLIYGTGLRVAEALLLQAGDIDFRRRTIVVRDGRGRAGREVMLPERLRASLRARAARAGATCLFPQAALPAEAPAGRGRCRPPDEPFQRAFAAALAAAGIATPATLHTLRDSFATQLLRLGHGVRTVQALLGLADASTVMRYLQALESRAPPLRSPLDLLPPLAREAPLRDAAAAAPPHGVSVREPAPRPYAVRRSDAVGFVRSRQGARFGAPRAGARPAPSYGALR